MRYRPVEGVAEGGGGREGLVGEEEVAVDVEDFFAVHGVRPLSGASFCPGGDIIITRKEGDTKIVLCVILGLRKVSKVSFSYPDWTLRPNRVFMAYISPNGRGLIHGGSQPWVVL